MRIETTQVIARRIGVLALGALGVLLGSADAAPAPEPSGRIPIRTIATEHGLHNLVINDVVQDATGFLAIATNDGVYRFDGDRVVRYATRGSNTIDTLALAPDGNLCGGSREGLMCWDGTAFGPAGAQGLPAVPVRKLAAFGDELWAATDRGLYVRRGEAPFVAAPGAPRATGSIWVDALGAVVANGTVLALRGRDGEWRELGASAGLGAERIANVLRDRRGDLWIRTTLHMWWLPAGTTQVQDLSAGLPVSYDTSAMTLGPDGELWVGLDWGIAVRDGDRWRTRGVDHGLPPLPARSLLVDREGSLWIGSTGAGLIQVLGRGLIERHDAAHGLPGELVWSIRRDPQGTLWIGTNRCLARAVDGAWTCLPGTEGRTVRSFAFADDGSVFLGGAPPELLVRDPAGNVRPLGRSADGPDQHILAMVIDARGDLWIGTRSGLFRMASSSPGVLERVIVPGLARDLYVSSIAIDDRQRVWFASQTGLIVLDGHEWRVLGARNGLATSSTQYVMQRRDGRMCVTYLGAIGLGCFRFDHGAVTQLEHTGVGDGLSSGEVYLFGEDAEQRLWVGTGDGLDVAAPVGFDHFGERQGLAGNDCSAMAFFLDRDGSIWIGSSTGLSHLAAQRYHGPPPPPQVAVVDARLDRQPIQTGGAPVRVSYDHNAFDVRFAAMSFLDAAGAEHQIRMLPVDREWRAAGLRSAAYPALPPGAYRFEVRARLGGGRWGAPTVLRFEVGAPWWQTGWFYALIGGLALGVLIGAYAWRQRVVLRRKSAQLIARSDASFRAVIESMADLVAVYRDGRVAYINAAGLRLFGLDGPGERRADADLLTRIHPEDQPRSIALLGGDGARHEAIELRVRGPDTSWRDCEVSVLEAEFGGVPALVLTGRDITERKRLQAKLVVSDRMASLGTLAAGIAHEINNPLTYLMGNLDVLGEALSGDAWPSPDERAGLLAAVADSSDGAERVRKIVKGLRSFGRTDDAKLAAVDLTHVLEHAVKMTANELGHHARLVRDFDPAPVVITDDGRLLEVFVHLIVNAAHAIPVGHSDEHRITLRTRTDDDGRAVIEIQDTGAGMAPDVLQHVFDPFFTTKDVGVGSGLGLSVCHGIICGLGGQISIESTLGVGTTVRVVLPRGALAATLIEPPDRGAVVRASRRYGVAIVDDEPLVGLAMKRVLARDHELTVFTRGQDLLSRIRAGERFDAIVSDVMMPTMTGLDLLAELQRLAPEQATRLIFITGGVFTEQIKQRLEELGTPRLDKPVAFDELRRLIVSRASEPN